ncbi:heterokaryon incompatibility protein-domain-containing protein [Trametes polyzona]|nr:heterokaryon incompatibility protein-domain-containing protein [Trametes polyzona]
MRLINTTTGHFVVVEDPRTISYAILSHVWAKAGDVHYPEMSYQDVRHIQRSQDTGHIPKSDSVIPHFPSEKIRRFCEIARDHGYDYAWADACCIDQTSSSEVSEAINSMYNWYRYASVCYVFLPDVPVPSAAERERPTRFSTFRRSKWHTRGWTLQELLAPTHVVFLFSDWSIIGTKHDLAPAINSATRIDPDVLTGRRSLEEFSVACRMSWAASRETTRLEDQAYSLMGIFGVNMPTTYGEGGNAFIRLQEEIIKHIPDQTIFAWGPRLISEQPFTFHHPHQRKDSIQGMALSSQREYLLAPSPASFKTSSALISISWDRFTSLLGTTISSPPTYTMTSYGVRTRFPLLAILPKDGKTIVPTVAALLACTDAVGNVVALLLSSQATSSSMDYAVGSVVGRIGDIMASVYGQVAPSPVLSASSQRYFRTTILSEAALEVCKQRYEPQDICVPYRPSWASHSLQQDHPLHSALCNTPPIDSFDIRIPTWCLPPLQSRHYNLIVQHRLGSNPYTIVISSELEEIRLDVEACNCHSEDKRSELSFLVEWFSKRPPERKPLVVPSLGPLERCHNHITEWTFRDGFASQDFFLPSEMSKTEWTMLRLTLRLVSSTSPGSRHVYVLSIETRDASTQDVKLHLKARMPIESSSEPSNSSKDVVMSPLPQPTYMHTAPQSRQGRIYAPPLLPTPMNTVSHDSRSTEPPQSLQGLVSTGEHHVYPNVRGPMGGRPRYVHRVPQYHAHSTLILREVLLFLPHSRLRELLPSRQSSRSHPAQTTPALGPRTIRFPPRRARAIGPYLLPLLPSARHPIRLNLPKVDTALP